jgi:pimeloyl-ACP methyl ester carboxylesterase
VPTTYVWSDRDSFVTRTAATGCGRYVEAPYRFEILRGVDHWIPENAAETVAPLILDQIRAV